MSDVYRETKRTASKDHTCVECVLTITKGTPYVYCSGVWDGAGFSVKLCQRCAEVRDLVCTYARHDPDECPAFGDMADWINDGLADELKPDSNGKSDIIAAAWPVLRQMVREGKRL